MSRRLAGINRSLHLSEENLAPSIDQEHLAFQWLPPHIQHLVWELGKVKREIITGAAYCGIELEQIDTSMVQVQAATKGLQDALKNLSCRINGQDNPQTQHEQVASHLLQTIEAEGAGAMGRDEQLGLELLDTEAQHQLQLVNHDRIRNAMMAELEANREARHRPESQIAELTQAVTSSMGQVKGKRSSPTPERSAGAGGDGGGRPPPPRHGAVRGSPDLGDSEGEECDNERRGRRNERPHQQNVKSSPGPPRGVMVPLVLMVHPDPPWSTFLAKFQKVWIRMDGGGPGGPRGPQPPLVDQGCSGLPWTTLRHFPDADKGNKKPAEKGKRQG